MSSWIVKAVRALAPGKGGIINSTNPRSLGKDSYGHNCWHFCRWHCRKAWQCKLTLRLSKTKRREPNSATTLGLNGLLYVTLSITILCHCAESRVFYYYAECHCAQCRYAEYRGNNQTVDKVIPKNTKSKTQWLQKVLARLPNDI